MRGHWKRGMGEIVWHRRETRRTTEKTNVALNHRASALLYPHREPLYNREKLVHHPIEKFWLMPDSLNNGLDLEC